MHSPVKNTVLVVDDEQAILRILRIRLRIAGYEVLTATSGQEALDIIGSARPDLVVLDIIMPGMDGLQVLKHLRSTSPALPVIASSAGSDLSGPSLDLGASRFIAKPFDTNSLVEEIGRLINGPK